MGTTTPDPFDLADDRDLWEQQPGESNLRFNKFNVYLRLGVGRSLRRFTEETGHKMGYAKQLSTAGHWVERTAAWDRHVHEQWRDEHVAEARRVADQDAALLRASMGKLSNELKEFSDQRLTFDQWLKLAEWTLKHRRNLYGDPIDLYQRAYPETTPTPQQHVDVNHSFDSMPPAAQLDALRELVDDNDRWIQAASGDDDDE